MKRIYALTVLGVPSAQLVDFLNARSDVSNWIEATVGCYFLVSWSPAQTLGEAFQSFLHKSGIENVHYVLAQAGPNQTWGFLPKAAWDFQKEEASQQRIEMNQKLVEVAIRVRAKGLKLQIAVARGDIPEGSKTIVTSAAGIAFYVWADESLGIKLRWQLGVFIPEQGYEVLLLSATANKGNAESYSDIYDVTDRHADEIAAMMTSTVRDNLQRGIEKARLQDFKTGYLSANDTGRVEFWSNEQPNKDSGFTIRLDPDLSIDALIDRSAENTRPQLPAS